MISRTKINKRMKKKTNSELAETIFLAKRHNPEIAALLSKPSKQRISINLDKINDSKEKTVIVPGKVLSGGELKKKIKIIAFSFSEKAKEKLGDLKIEIVDLKEELEKNKAKKLEGEILR